jgi:hypothetical protein
VQMLVGAASSAAVAALIGPRSALAVTGIMALCASAAVLVYFFVVRPAEGAVVHPYPSGSHCGKRPLFT